MKNFDKLALVELDSKEMQEIEGGGNLFTFVAEVVGTVVTSIGDFFSGVGHGYSDQKNRNLIDKGVKIA